MNTAEHVAIVEARLRGQGIGTSAVPQENRTATLAEAALEHAALVDARLRRQGITDPVLLADVAAAIAADHAAVTEAEQREAWRARDAVGGRVALALKQAQARRR